MTKKSDKVESNRRSFLKDVALASAAGIVAGTSGQTLAGISSLGNGSSEERPQIDNHELILTGIVPKLKIDKKMLTNFYTCKSYKRTSVRAPCARYPYGVNTQGTIHITPYPEQNGYQSCTEDIKTFKLNDQHSYQIPRKIIVDHISDADGYGHIIGKSNVGHNLKGIISHLTETELEWIVYGEHEHLGRQWQKVNIIRNSDGSYHHTSMSRLDHNASWEKYGETQLIPASI